MNVHLLYENKAFEALKEQPPEILAKKEDLELDFLLSAMSGEDQILAGWIEPVLYQNLMEKEEILYRQDILSDCLQWEKEMRTLYHLAMEGMAAKGNQRYVIFSHSPQRILEGAVMDLEALFPVLKKLQVLAGEMAGIVQSKGLKKFFAEIYATISDDYLNEMTKILQELHFEQGILVKARLGIRLKAKRYRVCRQGILKKKSLIERICQFFMREKRFKITIHDRDESGYRILSDLKDAAVADMATTVEASRDHVKTFFQVLRNELAFYMGALNLAAKLSEQGIRYSLPEIASAKKERFSCENLYNITLALREPAKSAANSIFADEKRLIVITGANQGGKTTFLRAFGQAHLMMSCGLFVAATAFCVNPGQLFTHFKREEDRAMKSGKFDEELRRMNALIDLVKPGDFLLMNESFAATNEREGSEIAAGIVDALFACKIRVLFVTHFYAFAENFYRRKNPHMLFLQAERCPDGTRSFRMEEGIPCATGFGQDIYQKIFEEAVK